MKNSELVKKLSKLNPDAEIGFEYLRIVDISDYGNYINLEGNGSSTKEKEDSRLLINVFKDDFNDEYFNF